MLLWTLCHIMFYYMVIPFYVLVPCVYMACSLFISWRRPRRKIDWLGKHVLMVGVPNELDYAIVNECVMKGAKVILLGRDAPSLELISQNIVFH